MKFLKIIPLLILSAITASCGNSNKINILTPTGAPAIAFYDLANNVTKYNVDTNSDPKMIVAALSSPNKPDFAVLPINAGLQAMRSGVSYKLAAVISFGNALLCSTGNDDNNQLDKGDTIVLFQKGQIPDLMFKNIVGDLYNELDVKYVNAASDAIGCLASGTYIDEKGTIPVDYVLVADPAARKVLDPSQSSYNPKAKIVKKIRDAFLEKYPGYDVMQAAIFVNTSINREKGLETIEEIKNSVLNGLENPTLIKEGMDKKGTPQEVSSFFGAPSSLTYLSLVDNNGLGLGFVKAYDNKESIDKILSIIAPSLGGTYEEDYLK